MLLKRLNDNAEFDNGFKAQWELFLTAAYQGTPFRHDLFDGARGVQLALLALESARVGRRLPVPPLDGFQALAPWLPEDIRERMSAASSQGMTILFLALWFVKPLNAAFWDIVYTISSWLGVDAYTGFIGFQTFRFWTH